MYCVMLEDCQRPHQYFVKMHLSVLVGASFGWHTQVLEPLCELKI